MITTLHGDCRDQLQTLPAGSVQCLVSSPPYYGLRRYSDDPREIGQEAAPDCMAWARREPPCGACYVCALRAVFAQAWRVLRDDGTAWLNLGDSYAGSGKGIGSDHGKAVFTDAEIVKTDWRSMGIADKNLLGIPWRVAFALQADGWYLRSDVIWNKPNCMPESVTDRPTRAHEYVFLLTKSARYFYDAAAIAEDGVVPAGTRRTIGKAKKGGASRAESMGREPSGNEAIGFVYVSGTRNKRTVWTIATQPYSGAHYATMPEALIAPCILAGSSAQACETCGAAWGRVVEKGEPILQAWSANGAGQYDDKEGKMKRTSIAEGSTLKHVVPRTTIGFAPRCACAVNTGSARSVVLDPFGGSGTVGRVATRYQRDAVLIELNQAYIDDHIETRTDGVQVELFV